MKPGDFEKVSVSKIPHFPQSTGLHKRPSMVEVHVLMYSLPYL
jgi:hypothetical protein